MTIPRPFRMISTVLFWLTVLACCGCASAYKVPVTDSGAPKYQRVNLVYSVDQFGDVEALRQQFKLTSATTDEIDESTDNEVSVAVLKLHYPHPNGDPGLALATVRFRDHAPETAGPKDATFRNRLSELFRRGDRRVERIDDHGDEVWKLNFPKQQLDLLLVDLAETGFFERQFRPDGGARIKVQLDAGQTEKSWTSEPRLDDFVNRVLLDGAAPQDN